MIQANASLDLDHSHMSQMIPLECLKGKGVCTKSWGEAGVWGRRVRRVGRLWACAPELSAPSRLSRCGTAARRGERYASAQHPKASFADVLLASA